MEDVGRAARISADASMQSVANIRERSSQQMRAYVSVIVWGGTYQERDKSFFFEGKPVVLNTGNTPAREVSHWIRAAIVPVPIAADFDFAPPQQESGKRDASLGPQQNFIMSAVVDGFVDDGEVDDIKIGKGRALHVWGIVSYKDIFGEPQSTKFSQVITWLPDGRIWGYYTDKHNEAT